MFLETLSLAFRAIRLNALRSVLTALGIIIGVAAVTALVTIGNGTTQSVVSGVSRLGSNLITVRPGAPGGSPGGARSTAKLFSEADAEAISEQVAGISAVAPVASTRTTAIVGNENWTTSVAGTNDDYFDAGQWTLASGRLFTDGELRSGGAVCIIGETVRQHLFGNGDPVDHAMRLQKMPCNVVGLLAAKGAGGFGTDQDDLIVVPLRAFQRRIAGNTDVNFINVAAASGTGTADVQADIEGLLRERRHIGTGAQDDFQVFDMTQITNTLSTITTVLTGLLGAVAAVSLLVGGIGIMNIMLVSITERTREIGIRLAIGALRRQVLAQFLVEAVVLSLFGGLVGIALGLLLALVGVQLINVPFVFDPAVVLAAFCFSGVVGIVFGYFPARRAAALNPIEALRHE
jgi:putative ABC transport system permease protein